MAKPRKIVVASDEKKKFSQPGAIELLRQIAEKQEWTLGFAVWAAAETMKQKHKMPADVTLSEIEAATAEIVARGKREKGEKEGRGAADNGRLPLNDEAQKLWDSGTWRGKLTVRGLRGRFAKEIADGVDLTPSMLDALKAEKEAEKARVAELADEHDDPDSKPVACVSPVHRRGGEEPFQPTVRFRLTRDGAGDLMRMRHPQGDAFIEVGNFLVVPAGDEEKATDRAVPYCADCREAAWQFGRQNETKVTFYTFAGAQRKLDAMKRAVENNAALVAQLKSAGARTFGGSYGTRKNKGDWRVTRRGSK